MESFIRTNGNDTENKYFRVDFGTDFCVTRIFRARLSYGWRLRSTDLFHSSSELWICLLLNQKPKLQHWDPLLPFIASNSHNHRFSPSPLARESPIHCLHIRIIPLLKYRFGFSFTNHPHTFSVMHSTRCVCAT